MKITSRKTHTFIELKVDETETTVYKSNLKEVEDMIYNLVEIANDLASYTDNSLKDYLRFFQNENIYIEEQVLEMERKQIIDSYKKGNLFTVEIVVEFAEWMVSGVSYVDDTERGRVYDYKHKVYTTKELFKEFLKTIQ